ncbi:PAS domain S-box protein [Streptomyces sp. NBC_01340]|uniref:SpoIIE family protein phosphatase n=1 Tax=unclassified Streptomyces TaxID=2593676 RepID=UPI0022541F18|nr:MULTISPECIES: PAS domain S-box protein [unclassified Streptomyces]MCX4462088.1 PAS domain S-box protein [Streptomyces sp. NBC_01719]MCX4490996.1 PAS domain S-box protein [Streptomyces sp. NBC_01728]MCX4594414.1 PAS domain S-box protein [Streptomyces sp. NBC_01549]WSI43971.1 PAS domain S-box protein [Streptomyces sp. NBC_01340]
MACCAGECATGSGGAEDRFRGLLEAAPDAMIIVDDTGTIRLVNAQTEALFGYGRKELLGRSVDLLVPDRFRAHHTAHRTSYADNRQVRPMGAGLELHGLRKNGTEFPVEISLSPLETTDGLLVSAAVRDVSDRKAAEERFRGLLEAAPDAMVIVDDTGTIRLVNAQTEALFGYGRKELLGRSVDLLVPDRFRAHHTAHRTSYADNRQVRPMGAGLELHGLRKNGTEFPVEISLSPLETTDGLLVSAAVRDVSDRKAAEERINELAALVESSQDAILAKTLDGHITYWNAAAQRLYGYTRTQVMGRHVSLLAPPDCSHEIDALMNQLRDGEKVEHFETLRVTRYGDLLDVDITLWPTRAPDGKVIGACAIVRDISDRKRAEAELTVLYEQQRHIALTLQRSLMGTPPAIPGLTTASRYRPATQGAGVGGDWFDLVPLGAGRVGVLIGDVMGRGLEAAAVMGQLRSAAHALAKTGMQPRQLMQALDAAVADLDVPDQLVTCCYLVIAADAGEVTICSAGHLPTLVATSGEGARALPAPVNAPLGVGGVLYQQCSAVMPPGATLVLYTDGLIETPGSDIEDQLCRLTTTLSELFTTAPDLEVAADHLLTTLLPDAEGHNDDVTLLLTRLPDAPLAAVTVDLPAVPDSVPEGRAFLSKALTSWGCTTRADDARLLLSEVLTNAVQHAQGPIGLHLCRTTTDLTVEVGDHSPQLPQPRFAADDDESGRGLILVRALADNWGVRPTDDGKTTWFTLAL